MRTQQKNNFKKNGRPVKVVPKNFAKQVMIATRAPSPAKNQNPMKEFRHVPGFHAVKELLKVRASSVVSVWLRDNFKSSKELSDLNSQFEKLRLKVELKSETALDKITSQNQGVIAFSNVWPELNLVELYSADQAQLVFLDGLEDPHNLGAILRTSWLMGVRGLCIPRDNAVGLTATVHKVACGGVEHVPVQRVHFQSEIEQFKKNGFWVFGLSHLAKQTVYQLKAPEKAIWIIGSEDKGLRKTTEDLCDELISIPQVDNAASYNASVATAIVLAENFRQQSFKN